MKNVLHVILLTCNQRDLKTGRAAGVRQMPKRPAAGVGRVVGGRVFCVGRRHVWASAVGGGRSGVGLMLKGV